MASDVVKTADKMDKDVIDPLSDSINWSNYVLKLPPDARYRYAVKLMHNYGKEILPDPYNLTAGWTDDPSHWPELEFGDIYCYLIETPGQYTKETLKAYKSLEAYRFVQSGHVQVVEYHNIGKDVPYCAVKAKVTPSQRITEKPHQPWVYLEKDTAAVYCAHCTCLAGLGEVCSHVAALLFKVEIGVKLGLNKLSSTSQLCQWNKNFRKELQPMTIQELQPIVKGRRNKPVTSISASGKDLLPDTTVLQSLKSACPSAVFFTTIPPLDPEETETASETGDYSGIVQPLTDLYYKSNCSNSDMSVLTTKLWSSYKCSQKQAEELEEQTRTQAISPLWFEQRKGRITGTKAHDVLTRRPSTSPDNLVRRITGSKCYNLANKKAVQWGSNNEDRAKSEFLKKHKYEHQLLCANSCGLLIDHERPYLAVSADAVVRCKCCPKRLLEIKCPYKHRDAMINTINDKDFCLDKHLNIKKKHRYYTQIQFQMFVHKVELCILFIFTNKDSISVTVEKDSAFCEHLISKCELFFMDYVLPELVSRKLENGPSDTMSAQDLTENQPENNVWCLCQEPDYGRMIECANSDCPTQWFHYECVNIRRCPRGQWLCPECTESL